MSDESLAACILSLAVLIALALSVLIALNPLAGLIVAALLGILAYLAWYWLTPPVKTPQDLYLKGQGKE